MPPKSSLEQRIDTLIENDIAHLQVSLAEVRTDVAWLKKAFWTVAGSSVGALMASVFQLIR